MSRPVVGEREAAAVGSTEGTTAAYLGKCAAVAVSGTTRAMGTNGLNLFFIALACLIFVVIVFYVLAHA